MLFQKYVTLLVVDFLHDEDNNCLWFHSDLFDCEFLFNLNCTVITLKSDLLTDIKLFHFEDSIQKNTIGLRVFKVTLIQFVF